MTTFSSGTRQGLSNQFLEDFIHDFRLDHYLPIFHAEQFFTEKIFYDQWAIICASGHTFNINTFYDRRSSSVTIRFYLENRPNEERDLTYLYTLTSNRKRYDLEIIYDGNSIFLRNAEQGITEWRHNYYANSLTDEAGEYVFPGDPIQD